VPYVPARGDLVWIDGEHAALIVSHTSYNEKVGLALLCPVTAQIKGYPFEVPLPTGIGVTGVVLADQIQPFPWKARRATRIGPAPSGVLADVTARIGALLLDP
jgi:mRNA interferase MazF